MKTIRSRFLIAGLALSYIFAICPLHGQAIRADDVPEVPRIDSVVMSVPQPQASNESVIWYDDFDGPEKAYTESQGPLDDEQAFGGQGRSMLSRYEKGTRGTGNRKVFFGDSPTGKVVRKGQSFGDIYWRVYLKHQHGWTGGGPAKLSRATSIVSPRWAQAMIGHKVPDTPPLRSLDLGKLVGSRGQGLRPASLAGSAGHGSVNPKWGIPVEGQKVISRPAVTPW